MDLWCLPVKALNKIFWEGMIVQMRQKMDQRRLSMHPGENRSTLSNYNVRVDVGHARAYCIAPVRDGMV